MITLGIIFLSLSAISYILYRVLKNKQEYFFLAFLLCLFLSSLFIMIDKAYGCETRTLLLLIITVTSFFLYLVGNILLFIFSKKKEMDVNKIKEYLLIGFVLLMVVSTSIYFGFSFISLIFFLVLLIISYIVYLKFEIKLDKKWLILLILFYSLSSYLLSLSFTALILLNDIDVRLLSLFLTLGSITIYLYQTLFLPSVLYDSSKSLINPKYKIIFDILKDLSLVLIVISTFFII